MSLTASVGLMAVFVVDFVDMIFISMLGQAKEEERTLLGHLLFAAAEIARRAVRPSRDWAVVDR